MGAGGRASTSVARPPGAVEDLGYDVVRLAWLAAGGGAADPASRVSSRLLG